MVQWLSKFTSWLDCSIRASIGYFDRRGYFDSIGYFGSIAEVVRSFFFYSLKTILSLTTPMNRWIYIAKKEILIGFE